MGEDVWDEIWDLREISMRPHEVIEFTIKVVDSGQDFCKVPLERMTNSIFWCSYYTVLQNTRRRWLGAPPPPPTDNF